MNARPVLWKEAIVLDKGTDKILLLAVVLFCGALPVVGPIVMDDEDLDLGGGISMAPNGHPNDQQATGRTHANPRRCRDRNFGTRIV